MLHFEIDWRRSALFLVWLLAAPRNEARNVGEECRAREPCRSLTKENRRSRPREDVCPTKRCHAIRYVCKILGNVNSSGQDGGSGTVGTDDASNFGGSDVIEAYGDERNRSEYSVVVEVGQKLQPAHVVLKRLYDALGRYIGAMYSGDSVFCWERSRCRSLTEEKGIRLPRECICSMK